ncbi:hypothetical protein GGX14DRAFT_574924 [Mycena pura]|uniref:Uncharacterized protein n=1 Tax=Mycena pura TaxID=153505 RepID=A0AAD6Y2Q5_9AGAR|nr:hypothetical protein GGX14DRAFT_574924 [Mycena pura]
MASTSPPPPAEDGWLAAMDDVTPVAPRPMRKRPRIVLNGNSDDEDEDELPAAPPRPAAQTTFAAAIHCLGESKHLRPEQISDAQDALNDPPAVQGAKLILLLHEFHNRLDGLAAFKETFAVSDDTRVNINHYAAAILLSTHLTAYRGEAAKDILLNILKVNRFDLPPKIESNPADFAKLVSVVEKAFTQKRADIKKALGQSMGVGEKPPRPRGEHQSIFMLTQHLVQGTKCAVTLELAARVALMRQVYREDPSKDFWKTLDKKLRKIRDASSGDAKRITRAFQSILQTDRDAHGINDYNIPNNPKQSLQSEVDSRIDAAAADKAASLAGAAGPSGTGAGAVDGTDGVGDA